MTPRPCAPAESHARSFDVELRRTGIVIAVPPEKSILEAIEERGIAVESMCRQGVCGTCETTVLTGEIAHHDTALTTHEREQGKSMMICVSRAADTCPRIILDL
jgi:ferredoxin